MALMVRCVFDDTAQGLPFRGSKARDLEKCFQKGCDISAIGCVAFGAMISKQIPILEENNSCHCSSSVVGCPDARTVGMKLTQDTQRQSLLRQVGPFSCMEKHVL